MIDEKAPENCSPLGLVLFNLVKSEIAKGLVGKVCLFVDYSKVFNRVENLGDVCNMEHYLTLLED